MGRYPFDGERSHLLLVLAYTGAPDLSLFHHPHVEKFTNFDVRAVDGGAEHATG